MTIQLKKTTSLEKGTTSEPVDGAAIEAQQKKLKGLEAIKTRRFVPMDQIERVRLFSVQAKDNPASTSLDPEKTLADSLRWPIGEHAAKLGIQLKT